MKKAVLPELNDLSDNAIVSRQLEPPPSLIATTGITFHGLERSGPLPVHPWTARGGARGTTPGKHGR